MELWDLYDENKQPLGIIHDRSKPLKNGQFQIIVDILVMNSQGQVLVTKRDDRKPYGGMWEITGGSKLAGEASIHAAIRELSEETGINVGDNEITYLRDFKSVHFFHDMYIVNKDIPIESIVLQEGETVDAQWITPQELMERAKNGTFVPNPAHRLSELFPDIFATS